MKAPKSIIAQAKFKIENGFDAFDVRRCEEEIVRLEESIARDQKRLEDAKELRVELTNDRADIIEWLKSIGEYEATK